MKRAIFKMGRSATVTSHTNDTSFSVSIAPKWLESDSNWDLPIEDINDDESSNGTKVEVSNLNSAISSAFSSPDSTLEDELVGRISKYYSYILKKGFQITVNGSVVRPKELKLLLEEKTGVSNSRISPFLYEASIGEVEVKLAVGFSRSIPDENELDAELSGTRKSEYAGWTIICNDRVVVYCDKTILTGWGEAKVPRFHAQFIGISGIVEFRCKDSRKLPITTTKSGIDASSELYLRTKNFMREGVKIFTNYVNKWRSNLPEEKQRASAAKVIDPILSSTYIAAENWTKVRNRSNERKYTPSLPMPERKYNQEQKIVFSRSKAEVEEVSDFLFETTQCSASDVGNECFERVLKEAQE